MTSDQDPDPRDFGERTHDADRRFVDALLHHHFHGDQAATSDRIAAALRRIDDAPVVAAPTVAASWWMRPRGRAAAALVAAALLLVPVLLSESASAAIDRARVVMARLFDQHYRIEIETPVGRTVSGEIWFRGADLVTLRLDTVAGALWAGEGRDVAWVVPPLSGMPVRVNDKGTLLEVLKMQDSVSTPFLRLSTLLERLGEWFEFEFGPDGETVEARCKPGAPEHLPHYVTVRLAPDGVVREFEGQWSPVLGGPRGCRLTWIDDDQVPASFYEHAAHHVGRDVIDLR